MSITRGVLAQSPEPEAHDKVLDNNPDRIGFWKYWSLRRGETGEKPLGAGTRNNNKLNPHLTPSPGIEPGPHWWEACVGGKCAIPAPPMWNTLSVAAVQADSIAAFRAATSAVV